MRNLTSLDLNLLVAFEALLLERSVSRAADRLGLAQPTMSGILARLRTMFGDELFVRTSTGMQPTTRAQELATSISEALGLIRQALNPIDRFEPQACDRFFTLGITDYANFTRIPQLVRRLRSEAPQIGVSVRAIKFVEVASCLESRSIDIAVGMTVDLPKHIAFQSVSVEKMVCISARANSSVHRELTLDCFLEQAQARKALSGEADRLVDQELARIGRERRVVIVLPNFYALALAVANSDLLAVVPETVAAALAAHLDLSIHEVPLDLAPKSIDVAWSRDRESDRGIAWLRDLLCEVHRV
jgi:LysR family transcriptional regulator, mexEF-oprN operon transcriptional activator